MQVLNDIQITRKIQRLAFQAYEEFIDNKELIVAGINGNGYELSKLIAAEIEKISPLKCVIIEIELDKTKPSAAGTKLKGPDLSIENKPVIIVDDVLNTGRTMVYAVSAFIREHSSLIRTMVLADRNHKRFPISADYVGISLATTLHEHLRFSIEENGYSLDLE